MSESYFRKEELMGKLVYNQRGQKIGVVKDVGYSKDGRAALVLDGKNGETDLSFELIQEIGEVILLKPEIGTRTPPQPSYTPIPPPPAQPITASRNKNCPKCGAENPPIAKFCRKCGGGF